MSSNIAAVLDPQPGLIDHLGRHIVLVQRHKQTSAVDRPAHARGVHLRPHISMVGGWLVSRPPVQNLGAGSIAGQAQ
ncbi:hypothetical protein [Micromonospora sp. NPDC047740]|uniref:hypothetical protein n=1 Tax=Micromonospora sp. NPDC047740 TaxID=3364254 RepID=UPI00371D3CA4